MDMDLNKFFLSRRQRSLTGEFTLPGFPYTNAIAPTDTLSLEHLQLGEAIRRGQEVIVRKRDFDYEII